MFLCIALLFQKTLAGFLNIDKEYINYAIWILAFDALVIIPFSKLRAEQRPIRYSVLKISNVLIYLLLNVFLLAILPNLAQSNPQGFWSSFYVADYQIGYVFLSNLAASICKFIALIPFMSFKSGFDFSILKRMIKYAYPMLFVGLGG